MNRINIHRTRQIGERIRQSRHAMGLSLQELSERTGDRLSKSRISNYEQGIRRTGLEEAEILAKTLGVSVVWLLGIEDTKRQCKCNGHCKSSHLEVEAA